MSCVWVGTVLIEAYSDPNKSPIEMKTQDLGTNHF